ncbi:MAG: outer membrane protein assembly factor BamA, partial [Thermodesulfobacteriota bacterium]|nr:outer membrane protein assembly factor BamA [Thermodesulfobacteriota bacterium]
MNHIIHRWFITAICLVMMPSVLLGAQISYRCTNEDLAGVLKDVPCISVKKDAPVSLSLEHKGDIYIVTDSKGNAFSATTILAAADGYLRRMDICVIKEVQIQGIRRIMPEAVRFKIKIAPGWILHKEIIKQDIQGIYSMGYFENCTASFEEGIVTFDVREYPVIIKIEVEGNKKIKDKEIIETIGLKTFDILNTRVLKTSIDRIQALYEEKGYYSVEVSEKREPIEGGIVLAFDIQENKRLFVKEVSFDGNEHIKAKKIKKIMRTKNRWWFGVFTHTGAYMDTALDTDLLRIEQFYGDNGYINVRVGRPLIEIDDDTGIFITIPIDEGPLYHIGEIDIKGDLIRDRQELIKVIGLEPGAVMSNKEVHFAMENLRDIYMDEGYAYVQITPRTSIQDDRVSIVLEINKNNPVHIDEIRIRGNIKTRDNVIRRELKLQETDLFSSSAIKKSKANLSRLGYFSKVDIKPLPEDNDEMSLLIDAEDTTTGAFSAGIAYSSQDRFTGTLSVSENNLMGRGLKAKAAMEYGKSKKTYTLDFEEPWLL